MYSGRIPRGMERLFVETVFFFQEQFPGRKGGNMAKKRSGKKKGRAGDLVLTMILIVAMGVFVYAAYNLYHIYTEYKKGTDEYNSIEQMAVKERAPDKITRAPEEDSTLVEMEPEPTLTPPLEIDFDALTSVNEDVVGWIYVEAIDTINYPVVKGEDNEEYLHTTYEGTYNFAGTIFIDCDNARDFSDCNTMVYGHNMKNGSMFGQLKDFVSKPETFQKSRYFWIFTPEKDYRYEIISAYTAKVDGDTYTLFKGPGKEFERYLNKIVGYSEIQTDPGTLSMMDRVVTLSTCTGNQATRFVVQGKLVDELDAA